MVQLRKDNAAGSLYNIVGFQTHLTFPEQRRVFSMIPGLQNAAFARYGVMHRNSFIHSPGILSPAYEVRADRGLFFAGQITGVEGYVESAASGLAAGVNAARRALGGEPMDFPASTAVGALAHYISNEAIVDFQPMNISFGLIEYTGGKARGKRERRERTAQAALETAPGAAAADGYGRRKRGRRAMRILVDAMGGDNAPLEILKGCKLAADEYGYDIILCGDEGRIRRILDENGLTSEKFAFADAPGRH